MKRMAVAIAAMSVLIVALACSNQGKLEGEWHRVNGNETLSFFGSGKSGTVVRVAAGLFGPTQEEGTFSWLDDTSIRLEFPGLLGPEVAISNVAFSGDRLTLKPLQGQAAEYQRSK